VAVKSTREKADLAAWKATIQLAKAGSQGGSLSQEAGAWLQQLRTRAGLSQTELAERLGLKYPTFIAQVENGFGRVPTECMQAWAEILEVEPADFARRLLSYYEPELHRLLFTSSK
jgi:DNA-binding XRE family transcriptional regulator